MGHQIVKRKKKGRPSKADLARRAATSALPSPERDVRRSLRRRNVRYMFDFDDFLDDDDEDEDEDDVSDEEENARRREKKELKQLLKSKGTTTTESEPSRTRRDPHARPSSSDEDADEEEEDENGRNRSKKRRINGDFELHRDESEEGVRGNEIDDGDDEEVRFNLNLKLGISCYITDYTMTVTELEVMLGLFSNAEKGEETNGGAKCPAQLS